MKEKTRSWLEKNLFFGSLDSNSTSEYFHLLKSNKPSFTKKHTKFRKKQHKIYVSLSKFLLPLIFGVGFYVAFHLRSGVFKESTVLMHQHPVAFAVLPETDFEDRLPTSSATAFIDGKEISFDSDLQTKQKNFFAVGGNFDLQVSLGKKTPNANSVVMPSALIEQLSNFQHQIEDLQDRITTLKQSINHIDHRQGDNVSQIKRIQTQHSAIGERFLDFLKHGFALELHINKYRAFGWTAQKLLNNNPQLSGLSVRTIENQTIRLTKDALRDKFFYSDLESYNRFQLLLDAHRELNDAIFTLNDQHQAILTDKDSLSNTNLGNNFSAIQTSVNDLRTALIQGNENSKSTPKVNLTMSAPSTLSFQGYRRFSKVDLAASFSLDSTLSFGLGKCKLFPGCGFENAGLLLGFDVGGSYRVSTQKFGPHAKIFMGLGGCF